MNKKKWLLVPLLGFTVVLYFWLFTLVVTQKIDNDFSSLYASLLQLQQYLTPYTKLFGDFLVQPLFITVNLNPPSTLLLFYPLVFLSYTQALFLYLLLSSIALVLSAWLLSFKIYNIPSATQRLTLSVITLLIFPVIICMAAAQMGALLLVLIVAGWYFDRQDKPLICAVFWGVAIAIKLFPGLLIFYCLLRKRYSTVLWMCAISAFLLVLPLVCYGPNIYLSYFKVIDFLFWYDSNWNGSLFGFLSRLYGSAPDLRAYSHILQITSLLCVLLGIACYIKITTLLPKDTKDRDQWVFCVTIVAMLLLSPLGWVYYYPLLSIVIIKIIQTLSARKNTLGDLLLWWLAFFLINIPLRPFVVDHHYTLITRLGLSSFYFYGLSLLLLVCYRLSHQADSATISAAESKKLLNYAIGSSLVFSVCIYMASIAMQTITSRVVIP